jgi:cardiolipin synthase A/B
MRALRVVRPGEAVEAAPARRAPARRRSLREQPWWVLLFFGLGVLALVSVLVGLFLSVGRRPPELGAPGLPGVESPAFLDAVAGAAATSVHAGGRVELLENGDQFYPALLTAIGSARRSVTFLAYIWEDGEVSARLLEALGDRARRGVEVRVLLDAFGAALAPRDGIKALEAAGARVGYFRPVRFGMLTRLHRRNHRRAIVVDGTVGFTGGAAVGDKWKGAARTPEEWRDSMVRVTGPPARTLQGHFAQSWAGVTGQVLAGPAFFPAETGVREPVDASPLRHVGVASSPSPEAHPLRLLFWLSFQAARQRLYLRSSYFVPDEQLRRAVVERARAGVDVRLLLPGEHTDAKPIRWASHGYYDELLSAGVRIYEYAPTFMHAKLLVVDGRWAVVGSANMDVRSKELNEENALGVLDGRLAGEIERSFLADLERSREIRLEQWRERGLWRRALERVASVFAEQF